VAAARLTVSAVIPSYNHGRFIGAALASVLAQTRPPDEIVVVDDGSTDETAAVVAGFEPRVRMVRRSHEGVGAAYNAGVREARGDVVAWLESDDLWQPEYIESTAGFLEEHPEVAWVGTARAIVDARGRPTGELTRKRDPETGFTTASCLERDLGFSSTPVIRRAAVLEVGPYATDTFLADNDMMLRFSRRHRMAYLDRPLYLHRRHGANTSGNLARNAREMIGILERFRESRAAGAPELERPLRACLAKYQGMTAVLALEAGGEVDGPETLRLLGQAVRNDPTKLKHLRRWFAARILGPRVYQAVRRLRVRS
jgi:glycosyltransferase involved in cell wall biosynthesis